MTAQTASDSENDARTWTFRGYQLDPANFTTAMVHFYRGEMQRANTWRTRLDATTNWAVITVAAALTFVFGGPQNPHFVLLLVFFLMFTFLMIEARRYRYYVLWAYRVHLMETDFFASIFTPPFHPSPDWANHLAESLNDPSFPITQWEAMGRRFRRNYVWLITLLLVSWVIKLAVHPLPVQTTSEMIERAAVGAIPGAWVIGSVGAVYVGLVMLAVVVSAPKAGRIKLPDYLRQAARPVTAAPRPQERLATIITSKKQAVVSRVLEELGRGVTALEGTGMYTGEARSVLLCAVTDVQVSHLEDIVTRADPDAFLVVSRAEKVHGGGFRSFQPPS